MKNIDDFIVPWVKDIKPYRDDHISYAWENPSIDRMMSNENFHSPSERVINAVIDTASKGNLYPHGGAPLREKIARLAGLKVENVFIANGSSEVIDVIARVFIKPGEEAIIPIPTFSMYEVRVKLCGGTPVYVLPEDNLTWDPKKIIDKINPSTRLIFITSPNNPLGSIFPEYDLRRVLDSGVPTVVDEAYYELEDDPRPLTFLLKEYPNLILSRTMSKAWGIAGFRLGYSLASEKITDYLTRMRINFSVGTINMAAAMAALDDTQYFNAQNSETKKLRRELEQELGKIEGLRVFHSAGNFILMDSGTLGIDAQEIIDYLLKQGVQIRPMTNPPLGSGFFRITIGSHEQNMRFVEKLKQFISERKS